MGHNDFYLDKNVAGLVSYRQMKEGTIERGKLPRIEYLLNELAINYVRGKDSSEMYKVKYINGKGSINGVSVPKAKFIFVLSRMRENTSKEEISIMAKLNGMKSDFVNMTDISVHSLYVPINTRAIDDKTFEIEFLEKKNIFSWDEVKESFFYGGSSRTLHSSFSNSDILELCGKMGIKKIELFDILKRIKMLNSLEEEDKKNGS